MNIQDYFYNLGNAVIGNTPTALGNPQSTVNSLPVNANVFTPLTAQQIQPLLNNSNILATRDINSIVNYANTNRIGLDALTKQFSTVDGQKAFASLLDNQINNRNILTNNNTWNGIGTAIQGLTALGNLYLGYKGLKEAKRVNNENIALQRANYRNSARALNNQYRDQLSGRGYNGMSAEATRALGREYDNRKVNETY